MNDAGEQREGLAQKRYRWPWVVLVGVLLGIGLAMLWLSKEIERTRRNRDLNAPALRL